MRCCLVCQELFSLFFSIFAVVWDPPKHPQTHTMAEVRGENMEDVVYTHYYSETKFPMIKQEKWDLVESTKGEELVQQQ
jgi:hypothetical protein